MKLAPTAAKLTVFFSCNPRRERKLICIAIHAANNGRDIVSRRVPTKRDSRYTKKVPTGHYSFVLVQSERIGGSDYCTQRRCAVKSDTTLPESNTRWRIARAMRGFF